MLRWVFCLLLSGLVVSSASAAGNEPAQSVAVYQKACDDGSAGVCSDLGVQYENGAGGLAVDRAKAAELFGKACKAGFKLGCDALKPAGRPDRR